MSVRIVVMDHYQAEPIDCLDPVMSDRGFEIRRVPVIRVFGSTPAGQKVTLHLHGIFPYLYIPMPAREKDGFSFRLASAIDKAINSSLAQSKSGMQHVYKAVQVSGRPFYGYHPRQHNFIKVYFYNYYMLKRAAEQLSNGMILNQVLQPHESHVPYELQFMMDYNLQGMNLIHLRHVVFRQGRLQDEYDEIEPFFDLGGHRPHQTISQPEHLPPQQRFFDVEKVPDHLKLPPSCVRSSTSELEIDAVAADILNCNQLGDGAMSPGLKVLWEDERERRRILGISDPLTPPSSPPRSPRASASSDSELFWLERFDKAVAEKTIREEGMSTEDNSPSDMDATINIEKNIAGMSEYAAETDIEEEEHLQPATQLSDHVPALSQSLLDISLSATPKKLSASQEDSHDDILDDSFSYDVATQLDDSQNSSFDESDEEFVDLLVDMADLPLGQTEKLFSQGERPSSQGEKPSSQGEKPSSQGEKPSSQGEKRSSQGEKRSSQGEKPSSQGENPVSQSDKPSDVLETAQSNNGYEESDKSFKSDATENNRDSTTKQSDDMDLLNDGDDDMFLSPDDEAVETDRTNTSQSPRLSQTVYNSPSPVPSQSRNSHLIGSQSRSLSNVTNAVQTLSQPNSSQRRTTNLSQNIIFSPVMSQSQNSPLIGSQSRSTHAVQTLSQPNSSQLRTADLNASALGLLDDDDKDDPFKDDIFDDEDFESLEMSQIVWDSDPLQNADEHLDPDQDQSEGLDPDPLDSSLWGEDQGEDEFLRGMIQDQDQP